MTITATSLLKRGAALVMMALVAAPIVADGPPTRAFAPFIWRTPTPFDCPFPQSLELSGVLFEGVHSDYRFADTWYPSWAADGNLYSPFTDGDVYGEGSNSDGYGPIDPKHEGSIHTLMRKATTGQAVLAGSDPLHLSVKSLGTIQADPYPYGGRYPCGSLVHNGVWYYGTYTLSPHAVTRFGPTAYNWPWLGPLVGFRTSTDLGKTWGETPHTPARPLFGESGLWGYPVKIGAPHFVDFGKNMEHSPDGKAYLVAMGAEPTDPLPRFENLSWITADQVYLLRVTPSVEAINDASKYEFYGGRDARGADIWTHDLAGARPLLEWNNHMGCVTVTYDAPLKKYLMCVTDGGNTCARMHTYILEADRLTGPWRLVTYMRDFGQQAYFVNIPSKFIASDGTSAWLCYSANFAPDWNNQKILEDPPGSRYGLVLQKIRLLTPAARREWEAAQFPSPSRIKELQAADKDILGSAELAKREDPSYGSVASQLPAMKSPREAVGVPFHPHEIGIAADGTLQLADDVDAAGAPTAFFEVGQPAVRFGSGPDGCVKSLSNGYLPIVIARYAHDGIEYTETVFGSSDGLSPDRDLWAYVELEALNPSGRPRETAIGLRFAPPAGGNRARTWKLTLAAGAASRLRLRIPFDLKALAWTEVPEAEFDAALKAVSAFWTKELSSGMTIDVPEARVNDAVRAWQAYAMLDVDRMNGILEPHDGSGFYEEVYGYSAALLPHALDLWGRPAAAREILDSLLTLQRPDGLFTSHFGTPDPGTLLSSLWEHYALTGDLAWLRSVAPKMIKMADWIIAKRKESLAPAGAKKGVTNGLIKFSPYCDYQTPSFDYFGDTYCAVGLEKTARALEATGQRAEAARIGREAAAYRRDILASMDAAVLERDGLKILPMEPDTQRLLKSTNFRGGGYYGLIASCMLESEFLPATDARAGWVMRFMEEKGGLRLGMAEFDGGVDHAYTYGYWLDCLKLGRIKEAILGLYASLAYGMSRETYSGVEVTHLFTGANEPTLPHLYSCTQQLRLLRMMLVREDGPDLLLGQAIPRPWLEAGRKVAIKDAPTTFGPVSLTIESHTDRGRIDVRLAVPARQAPRKLLLRLRHPQERPIKSVTVDGRPVTSFAGDTITLASPRGTLSIVVTYE